MSLRAGFCDIDITPPPGTRKIGWLKEVVGTKVADPIYARICVLESGSDTIAFVQLDTLSIRWTQTNDIRQRVAQAYGYPGANVMVTATHSHAGPAVANCGDVTRDEAYIGTLVGKVVDAFGRALDSRQDATLGMNSVPELELSHNRRMVLRDGTAKTHGQHAGPDSLYQEGPIDPEVAVLAARGADGQLLGSIVNFACHPTHHGPDEYFSAGWPGALCSTMKERGCPVTLFLNGACGNVSLGNPYGKPRPEMEEVGARLADDAEKAIAGMTFRDDVRVASRSRTIQLPYRELTEEQLAGTARGAQRFIDPAIYDRSIPRMVERIRTRGTQPVEVQVHFIDEYAIAAAPAEYFVELGLMIKEAAYPTHALVSSCSNGMVGYLPTKAALARGGYETTFTDSSRMGVGAGEMVAECAIEIIRGYRAE